MSLQHFDADRAAAEPELGEKIIRKLRAGMMPPREAPRPEPATLRWLADDLERQLDLAAAERGDPGSRPFQRLNRAEYARLIQDLLGLTVDPADWLPPDQLSASFDNIADVQTITPTLMTAYLTAAGEIARMAVGDESATRAARTYENPPAKSQHEWERVEGAPYGTRGGISVLHNFPADGTYRFSFGFMSGWGERHHDIDVSVDGEQIALVRYGGSIDFQGRKKFPLETEPLFVRAGQQRVVAAFVRQTDGTLRGLDTT